MKSATVKPLLELRLAIPAAGRSGVRTNIYKQGAFMQLSLGHSLAQRVELTQEIRLSHKQILDFRYALRMELVATLRDEEYRPKAKCPRCYRELTAAEIVKGFLTDPNDFTTGCPNCARRFEPRLVCFMDESSIEFPFFCSTQTLAQLSGKESFAPHELAREHPAIYRAAIVHHGTLRKAFAAIGITYVFPEVSDWRHKVAPFLGRLPDTIIAECTGASPKTVRGLRRSQNIPRFTARRLRREAEEYADA